MLGAGFALSLLFGAPDARAQDGGGTSGQLEQGSATTDKEKQDFATQAIAEMQNAVKSVGRKLEAAEKEGDDLKIQCLSKKLSGIRALSEVSEDAQVAMERAINSGDSRLADHEFRKIAVALSKVRQFMAEADACVGDLHQRRADGQHRRHRRL
jgi:hypothetical protein